MSVLSNAGIRAGAVAHAAASSGGDAYQIEKSIRSNRGDDPQMIRLPNKKGNKLRWTVSFWAKRCFTTNTHEKLFTGFGPGNDACGVRILSDYVHFYHYDPDTYDFDLRTNALLRDPSAWYHIVCVYDSVNAIASERAKIYINGKLASLQTATYPAQYHNSHYMNDANTHYLFREASQTGQDYNGYIADFQFIDGLALSPAAFGSFDSTGVWNPKAFAKPAPNTGTTLSGGWSGTFTSGNEATKSFDGLLTTGSKPSNTNTITWTGDIAVNQGVRIYFECDDHSSAKYADIYVNGIPITPTAYNAHWDTADVVNWGANNLTEIKTTQANNKATTIKAIEVDGVILVDGRTDVTTRNNLNDGRNWTTWGTETGTAGSNNHKADKLFNGTNSQMYAAANNSVTWTAPGSGISYTTLRIFIDQDNDLTSGFLINGTDYTNNLDDTSYPGKWYDVGSWLSGANLTSITAATASGGSPYAAVTMIEVDGHMLLDDTVDNSFHLKFNDITNSRTLGKDTLQSKLEDCTGALPIYNTSDDYGIAKGSGHRTDSNASNLFLAVPGDAIADVSHSSDLRNSGSALSLTNNGTVATTSDYSHFYGSALSFNGSDQWLDVPSISTNNNNKFCIECWVKHRQDAEQQILEFKSSDSSGDYLYVQQTSGRGYRFRSTAASCSASAGSWAVDGDWVHLAFTNDGSTTRGFVNGILFDSFNSSSWSIESTLIGAIGAGADSGHSQKFKGYIQDVRAYFGIAKYTANFIVPKRNDFTTVTNLTAGAETATAIFNWRPKASLTDDASAKDYAISNTGTTQSTTSYTQKAHTSTITRTSGTAGFTKPDYWTATPPGNGVNGGMIYGGRSDTQWTFSPAVVSPSGNITARCDQNGGSTGADKIRFYDGSSWTAWFDITASANFGWTNIATGVSTVEKVEFDCGGATDSNLAGFYLNGGTADSDWWMWRNGEDFGITQAGWFEKDNGDAIITDSAVTIPTNFTFDYWACPEFSQKGNGTILDTATEQTIRDYGSSATGNGTMSRVLKITSTDDSTVYDFPYTTRAGRWHHVRITNTGVWVNGTKKQNSQASNYNVPNIAASSHRLIIGNYTTSGGTSYSFNGLIGPVRIIDADLGAPPAGGLVIDEESGSSSDTPTNNPVTNTADDYDILNDSPTNYGTDEQAGGEVRGNFCVLNSVDYKTRGSSAILNGGLTHLGNNDQSGWSLASGTIPISSDTTDGYYFEFTAGTHYEGVGWWDIDVAGGIFSANQEYKPGDNAGGAADDQGTTYWGTEITNFAGTDISTSGTIGTIAAGDVIGCAIKNNKIYYARNNTWTGNPSTESSPAITLTAKKNLVPFCTSISTDGSSQATSHINFGQRPFKYTAPTGYKCICTQNLPDLFSGDQLNDPSKYFDIKLYKGTGSDQTIKGVGFNPDFIWIKERSDAQNHQLYDVVRGSANNYKRLEATTGAQETKTSGVQTFNSDGFDIGDNVALNESPQTYVSWLWDVGSSGQANTDGDINISSPDQWVNQTAGVSITKWTASGSDQTIGHGLGAKPEFIMTKRLDDTSYWQCYHKNLDATSPEDYYIRLESSDSRVDAPVWNDTAPTSTVFTQDDAYFSSSGEYIAYCWTSIPGFSKFGKYDGDSAKPFVYLGFKPKFIIIKGVTSGRNWIMVDSERFKYNGDMDPLYANSTVAQQNHNALDILSNGFKIVDDGYSDYNVNDTLVYAAWAEHPQKTARAR